jgi:hypothetical protein
MPEFLFLNRGGEAMNLAKSPARWAGIVRFKRFPYVLQTIPVLKGKGQITAVISDGIIHSLRAKAPLFST